MAVVKFGYKKSSNGNLVPLKFGLFEWGQPIKFYLLNNLLEYLPLYIERNKLCKAIMKAIAVVLLRWQKAARNLKVLRLSGKTGIKYANENWKLFLRNNSEDADILHYINKTYLIHKNRGTEFGMQDDIVRITYDKSAWFKYYRQDKCGWWLDQTFPDISTDGYTYKMNKLTYLDLENMLFIEYYNRSKNTSNVIEKLLLHEAIPANINTTFLELKPFEVKFGTFKFARRKFGEIRAPKQFLIG